jgi:hypothetical protein
MELKQIIAAGAAAIVAVAVGANQYINTPSETMVITEPLHAPEVLEVETATVVAPDPEIVEPAKPAVTELAEPVAEETPPLTIVEPLKKKKAKARVINRPRARPKPPVRKTYDIDKLKDGRDIIPEGINGSFGRY